MNMKKGINLYTNFAVNEFGTIAKNLETNEIVQVTTTGRYNTFNFKRTTINAHTLVAHAWLADSYEEGLEVDHLNGKDDNHYLQLEWVTHSENCKRAAKRRSSAGVKTKTKGNMNYQLFVEIIKARYYSNLTHGQMVQYIGNTFGEWFDISYYSKLLNKVTCKKYWAYLSTDSTNNHLYTKF